MAPSQPALPLPILRSGKVRDLYDLGDRLLLVATDRISAFDWILPNQIPDKGRVLTALSAFWFNRLPDPNHLLSTSVDDAGLNLDPALRSYLDGRVMITRKARVIPFECVVRGYLAGSGWKEYRQKNEICGENLPPGLVESDRLPTPLFTPATKADSGHDLNVPFSVLSSALGIELAETLRDRSLQIYNQAHSHAQSRGILLADTKFEWGHDENTGQLLLIDEVLTPDSSRYWPLDSYQPGGPQPSFDKQFVRDWLEDSGWDKASPPPSLPPEVVHRTREKYVQAFETLSGLPFTRKMEK